ncbi:unnamed protein product [Sphagnum balticum]
MCHLLCLAVLLYSEFPPAEIWANKLCCHLKQGVFEHTRAGKDLAYRCIYRETISLRPVVSKKFRQLLTNVFNLCYYNFLIWKLENHMTKHVI